MTAFTTARRLTVLLAIGIALFGQTDPADSRDDGAWASTNKDSNLAAAETRIETSDYAGAIALLEKAIRSNPRDADAFQLLAHSQRKVGDLEGAAKNYQTALAIDPDHEIALAQQGTLFLALDQPDRAQANLQRLKQLCVDACPFYSDLKRAIAAYHAEKRGS